MAKSEGALAQIVTVFNQKGGCGKSTTAMSLAGAFARRGLRVRVVDMDPQGTASRWCGQADEARPFPASVVNLSLQGARMVQEVRSQAANFDLIVIDCPPAIASASLSAALLISDLALIPVQPSPADLWALEGAKVLLEAAQANNPSLVARTVPIRVPRRQRLANSVLEMLAQDEALPVTKATLGSLAAFGESMALGVTVYEIGGAHTAIAELEALADEVAGLLDAPLQASH